MILTWALRSFSIRWRCYAVYSLLLLLLYCFSWDDKVIHKIMSYWMTFQPNFIESQNLLPQKFTHSLCALDSVDTLSLWYELNTRFTIATLNAKRFSRIFLRSFTLFEFWTHNFKQASKQPTFCGEWVNTSRFYIACAIEQSLTTNRLEFSMPYTALLRRSKAKCFSCSPLFTY